MGLLLIFPVYHLLAVLNDNSPERLKLLILIRFVRNITFLDRHSDVSFNGWTKPFTNWRVSAAILICFKFPKWLLQAVTQQPVTVLLVCHIFFPAASSVSSAESAEPGSTKSSSCLRLTKNWRNLEQTYSGSITCFSSMWKALGISTIYIYI